MQFVEKCDELCILLSILPSHSIYYLQPLDMSLFSSLLHYYSAAANALMFNSVNLTNLFKRAFWSLFLPAWKKTFTPANIVSGFTKTGIFPYNPHIILDVITKSIPATASNIPIISKTPVLTHHTQKIYENTPTRTMTKKLILRNKRLTAQHNLDKHIIWSLCVAFKKKKRKR